MQITIIFTDVRVLHALLRWQRHRNAADVDGRVRDPAERQRDLVEDH